MRKMSILLIFLIFNSFRAFGASEPYTANISHLRVESVYGFITMEGLLPWAESLNCDNKRVWIDLRDEIDKIKYSTALAALMGGKKVYIRAVDVPNNLVFGACKLNDIIIYSS